MKIRFPKKFAGYLSIANNRVNKIIEKKNDVNKTISLTIIT